MRFLKATIILAGLSVACLALFSQSNNCGKFPDEPWQDDGIPTQNNAKSSGQPGVMFWNLENFFDYIDTAGTDALRMSKGAFYNKCDDVGKTILWIGDEAFAGRLPDVIGVAEVENAFVLRKIISSSALSKSHYRYIHYESPASRGIDNAILYNPATIKPVSFGRRHIFRDDGSILPTRDIVWMATSDSIAFLVNHHPSKYGGEKRSEPGRRAAVESLFSLSDSLSRKGFSIIAMGDFNDVPGASHFRRLAPILVNKSLPLLEKGEGTIRFEGKWELIDMFFLSYDIAGYGEMRILQPPFLMENDPRHGSVKPRRTFSGPRYLGGVSDHLPIVLVMQK